MTNGPESRPSHDTDDGGTAGQGSGEHACERVTSCQNETPPGRPPPRPSGQGEWRARRPRPAVPRSGPRALGAPRLALARLSQPHPETVTCAPHWRPEAGEGPGGQCLGLHDRESGGTGAVAWPLREHRRSDLLPPRSSRGWAPGCPQHWAAPGSGRATEARTTPAAVGGQQSRPATAEPGATRSLASPPKAGIPNSAFQNLCADWRRAAAQRARRCALNVSSRNVVPARSAQLHCSEAEPPTRTHLAAARETSVSSSFHLLFLFLFPVSVAGGTGC